MDNYLEYKGFRGTVKFSKKDDILHGKVQGVFGLIPYEGSSLKELKADFEGAVDDYIASFVEEGQHIAPPKYENETRACAAKR